MHLTVKEMKQILEQAPDDAVIATLGYGNSGFHPLFQLKRVLLLHGNDPQKTKYLTFNGLGSHFTGKGEQEGLTYIKEFKQ